MKTFFKKSALIFTVCMLLTLQLIGTEVANNLNTYAETESNETIIYNFLKEEMGFNTAAACGVLANIQKESGFRNDVVEYGYTWDTGGGYGICQWTNSPRSSSTGRRTNLVNWCNDNGYDYTSLIGQLNFLKHELNTNYYYYWVTSDLLKVDNSAQGAYDAGYIWCYYFEVPAGYDTGVSETRGNLAKNSYWTKYNNSEESFSSKIAYLQKKFPDGKYWNHSVGGQNNPDGYTSTPCKHHYGTVPCSHTDCQGDGGCCYYGQCGCNSYSNAVQCMGFALKLGYDIFGSDPRNWTSVKSLDNLKAGDIIMYNSHHIFVTSVNGNTITFADCNYNGNCQIRWNQTITKSNIKNLKYVLQSPATFEDTTPQDYLATKFSATVLDGIYLLKNTGGGLMANVYSGINADETNVMLWEYDKTSDQWFYIKHVGNGKYLIYAVCSKKSDGSYERCLDIYTGDPSTLPSAGDNVDIYTRSSSWDNCQLFYIVPMSDGTFVFESCAVPQLVIGASNVTQNYGNISMMAYSGSSAQKWKLCDEKGNDISNSSIYKTKVTFNYNSNSGQGTMSSSYAYQGDSITFTANTFTRDNYKFMGWKIQRDDGKWYIEEYGWYPEDIINERGYTVTVYPDCYTMVLDNDFVTQPDNFSCTLYAQWESTTTSAKWWESYTPVDLGTEFTAMILNTKAWKPIENRWQDGDYPQVKLADENGFPNQNWYFIRQNDGSYRIRSCYDGKYLDVRDAIVGNGVAIQTCPDSSNLAQYWFIYKYDNNYILRSKLSDCVMDITGGELTAGTPVQTYEVNFTDAQIFSFYKNSITTTTLSVSASYSNVETNFEWYYIYNSLGYYLDIYNSNGVKVYSQTTTELCHSVMLSAGSYTAVVRPFDYFNESESNTVSFTVKPYCTTHTWVTEQVYTPATCTSSGSARHKCSVCGETKEVTLSALGHNKISHSGQAATCTSKGWNAYETCSRCSYSTYSEIPVGDHNIVLKGINQFGSDIQCKGIYGCTTCSISELRVIEGFFNYNNNTYYSIGGYLVSGWFTDNGKTYYASTATNVVINYNKKIQGKYYLWNDETGLEIADGFVTDENGTKCYEDGINVIGWRHADGSGPKVVNGISEQYSSNPEGLYYFLSTTGYMVTDATYKLGGYIREFNDDHTVKAMNGLQTNGGELYYYVDGVKQTGWHTIDGTTYYFRASDAVYGRAATKWMYIGNKVYYFYASTSATPYALKDNGKIGGIEYTYHEDGYILYNGFVNCDYANAANSNTAANIQKMNGTTRYYKNGEMQTGWQNIGGNWYYFYAIGSANGSGYMCVQSRTIGGVWYEFTETGVCTNK